MNVFFSDCSYYGRSSAGAIRRKETRAYQSTPEEVGQDPRFEEIMNFDFDLIVVLDRCLGLIERCTDPNFKLVHSLPIHLTAILGDLRAFLVMDGNDLGVCLGPISASLHLMISLNGCIFSHRSGT